MTVQELIEALSKFPPDMEVMMYQQGDIDIPDYNNEILEVVQGERQTTRYWAKGTEPQAVILK